MVNRVSLSALALVAVGSLGLALSVKAIAPSNLAVEVSGLNPQRGNVCLRLFSRAQGFPTGNESVVQDRCAAVTGGAVMVNFAGLTAGNYAVSVLHDENSDQALNRNALGIPTEGIGFSRNPRIIAGPPSFRDSSVVVAGPNTQINIQIRYLLGR